jgi:hypothetical protein
MLNEMLSFFGLRSKGAKNPVSIRLQALAQSLPNSMPTPNALPPTAVSKPTPAAALCRVGAGQPSTQISVNSETNVTPSKFTPDGRPVYHVAVSSVHSHQTKGIEMSSIDGLVKSLESLSPELKRELVQRLAADSLSQISAAAAETAKKTRLSRIAACRDSRNPDFGFAAGILNRASISVEDCIDARALDRLSAAADRPISADQKMIVKSALWRLGVMAD